MTDATNAALPAGRELDAEIAEKVLGWKTIRPVPLPRYSTDWNAMRLVIERLVALGWLVGIDVGIQARCVLVADIDAEPRDEIVYAEEAPTLPHAVALAALAAFRAQQNPEAEHE